MFSKKAETEKQGIFQCGNAAKGGVINDFGKNDVYVMANLILFV